MQIVEIFALRWRPHFLRYKDEIRQTHAAWRNLETFLKIFGQGAPWGVLFKFLCVLPKFLKAAGSRIFRDIELKFHWPLAQVVQNF